METKTFESCLASCSGVPETHNCPWEVVAKLEVVFKRFSGGHEEGHNVHFARVEYDYEATIKKILAIDRLDDFHAERLREGR